MNSSLRFWIDLISAAPSDTVLSEAKKQNQAEIFIRKAKSLRFDNVRASFSYVDFETVSLDLLYVKPAYRGEGIATEYLSTIVRLADKYKVHIQLEAIPDDEGEISVAALTKFYKKFGFLKGAGRTRFMMREPTTKA